MKDDVKEKAAKMKKRWISALMILVMLALFSFTAALYVESVISDKSIGNVALIAINGEIMAEAGDTFLGESIISSEEIVKSIKDAEKDEKIKAIVIKINSPGGSAVASKEIADAIKNADKMTVAYIREIGTSGAYWAASAADHIIASEMAITGSIGVISSYLEYSGLLERYNVTHERLVAGIYKDMGSPLKSMDEAERMLFQKQLDRIQRYFLEEVAENRNLSEEVIEDIATARIYLGWDAKELGLVDELGGEDEVKNYLMEKLNLTTVEFAEYKKQKSFFDILSSTASKNAYNLGRGIASGVTGESHGVRS